MTTLKFALHNLKRLKSDASSLFFNIALPVILYLIFGAAQQYSGDELGNGNVAAFVMLGMALYAGVSGAVSQSSLVVVEHNSGWGRQLALTPLTNTQIAVARLLVILVNVVLPVAAVFLTGALGNAEMDASAWFWSFLITVTVSLPFGFYGLVWAQSLKSLTAVSIAATSVTLLAFAGNTLFPLTSNLIDFSRFTPMYGATMLSRWPLAEGLQLVQGEPVPVTDPLWQPLLSIIAWTVIFAVISLALDSREKGRA